MTVEAKLEMPDSVPQKIRDVAEKWSEAVSAALDLIQERETTSEEVGTIIDLALHSAAAVVAPGDLGPIEFANVVSGFAQALADVSAAFLEDKKAALATRQ